MQDDSDFFDDDTPEETDQRDNADIRRLREKAKKADEAEARAQAAERKLAVAEAGLQLSPRQLDALSKVHDGEWTAEALKATATDLGFAKTPEPEPKPDPAFETDLAAHRQLATATAGGDAAPPVDFLSEMKNAQSIEEVMALAEKHGRFTSWQQ